MQNAIYGAQARWATGGYTAETAEKTAMLSANAIGFCEALQVQIDGIEVAAEGGKVVD